MQNNSKKWYIIAAIFYVCCLVITPLSLYDSYQTYTIIFESLICIFFVVLGINNINKITQIDYSIITSLFSRKYRFTFLIILAVLSFGINYVLKARIEYQIETNGITTEAFIENKSFSIQGHSSRYTRVRIKNTFAIVFNTTEGKKYTVTKNVDKTFYEQNLHTRKIKIRYLPNHPTIFKIL